ncbi:MAG: hypothetical protein C5B58_00770 [Acidobacteria bacterium]|nr:MAG: hypothetical protein C5B58_00770 [Acidobacteriota bacterium]
MPGPPPRLHLPYKQWPAPDRLLWERAMEGDDPFADSAGVRLSKATQRMYLWGWRRYLGYLAIYESTALDIGPVERVTSERIRAFAVHLRETNSARSVAHQVHKTYLAARVMMPEHDWTWLKNLKTRLFKAAPARAPRGPVITSLQLLELGKELMDESLPGLDGVIGMEAAVRYRDGLIFMLLAFQPLRRKNLAALEIGRHLLWEDDRWALKIPAEETKTGVPIDFVVPELLASYFNVYLGTFRPYMLQDAARAALWLNTRGRALAYAAIGDIIGERSTSRLNFRITPHDARDAAATTWAVSAPDQIGVSRDLLTHRDLRTTTKWYNRARGIEASRAHNLVIAELRRKRIRK